jgi:hypothetical protein
VIQELRVIAVGECMEGTPGYNWRRFCRAYSRAFHTPLHLVLGGAVPAEEVARAVIEENLDAKDDEELMAYAQEAIGTDESEERLIREQVEMFEAEEEVRQERLRERAEAKKRAGAGNFRNKKVERLQREAAAKKAAEQAPEVRKTFDMGDPDEE